MGKPGTVFKSLGCAQGQREELNPEALKLAGEHSTRPCWAHSSVTVAPRAAAIWAGAPCPTPSVGSSRDHGTPLPQESGSPGPAAPPKHCSACL